MGFVGILSVSSLLAEGFSFDWIISLAAVLVSMVTVVIGYFTNRENLRYSRLNVLSERRLDHQLGMWKEVIEISDKLLQATDSAHIERTINSVLAFHRDNRDGEEVILNEINDHCETIRSLDLNLCARIKALDPGEEELQKRLERYVDDVISVYRRLQDFHLNQDRAEYDAIVASAAEFEQRNKIFSRTMRDYIAKLPDRLFEEKVQTTNKGE